jgi:hypothetical protein
MPTHAFQKALFFRVHFFVVDLFVTSPGVPAPATKTSMATPLHNDTLFVLVLTLVPTGGPSGPVCRGSSHHLARYLLAKPNLARKGKKRTHPLNKRKERQ